MVQNSMLIQIWYMVSVFQTLMFTAKAGDCSEDFLDFVEEEVYEVEMNENVTYASFMAEMALTESRLFKRLSNLPYGVKGPPEGSNLQVNLAEGIFQLVTKVSKGET